MGKLSTKTLKELLSCIREKPKVIIPPMPGFDSGVHEISEDVCMVVTTDPCLGVPKEWFGWFLIHYAASDVAVFGARPEYAVINLLGPPKTNANVFKRIMRQACQTADELNMSIITGHTGTYDELSAIIGTCTAYSFIQKSKLMTPADAKPSDHILCIKPIGQETLTNFALTHRQLANKLFSIETTSLLATQIKMQTCVNEALTLAEMGGVSAMHDATEGGLVAALNEIADASNLGFTTDYAKLPITKELQTLARHFRLSRKQVMSTSSTGTLIAAVSPIAESKVIQALAKHGIAAARIGVFTESRNRTLRYQGKTEKFPLQADDPYGKIMRA
jgi:hydrogenase expression/formation protein HypE